MRARSLLSLACLSALPTAASAADLALTRVMLSTGGVGYFEYAADVDGQATLGLDIPLDQVDDVLKSLVVLDGAGSVGGVDLPGRDASRAAFGDVPFGPDALQSPLDFLNSLQGVAMQVTGPRPMSGRLMRAEAMREPAGTAPDGTARTLDRTRVTLLSDEGLRQFVLEDADSVQVADPELRTRIARAVAALRREAGQDTRHLTIRTTGQGHRTVRVGYVAAAPLWKTTYRLVLPQTNTGANTGTAQIQAWAVLENASGADWHDVSLTLQYGNPVTFHQAIYRSYFVDRPDVPVEVLGRLLPDIDTRARSPGAEAEPAPPAPAPMGAPKMFSERSVAAPAPLAPAETAAVATEGVEQTEYAVSGTVTLAAGHTASVPLLDRNVPAVRIDLLTEDRSHPLAALRLKNDTGVSLPAGVLTLYDDLAGTAPYAGDARLGGLPDGEQRLLSFAEDLRTTAEWQRSAAVTIAGLTASRGVLRLDQRNRIALRVVLTAPAKATRHVLVEVPKSPGVVLVPEGDAKPEEETPTAWRLGVDLAAGEVKTLAVNLDRVTRQQIALVQDNGAVARILGMQGLSPDGRAALERLAALRTAEAGRQADRDRIQARIDAAEKDEARLRDNLGAVAAGDVLHGRLTRQLEADETTIASLSAQLQQAQQALDDAHAASLEAIGSLSI